MMARRSIHIALLVGLTLVLPLAQPLPAAATESLYYAAAIGETTYLPSRAPATAPEPRQFNAPAPSPELPALGAKASPSTMDAAEATGLWTKVLIGVAVVATMALVAKSGGDTSAEVPVGSGGSTGGGSVGGGGGGILPLPPLPGGGTDDDDRKKGKGK